MNRKTQRLVGVIVTILSFVPLAVWAGEPSPRLLLRWQFVVHGDGGSSLEILIFRDGLAFMKLEAAGQVTYGRLQANPGAMTRLQQKLAESRVGSQPEETCRFEELNPQAPSYDAIVTWFGWRQRRFVLSTVVEQPQCTSAVESIGLAVQDFLGDVRLIDAVPTVP